MRLILHRKPRSSWVFGVEVIGFAVMSNHMHVIVRTRPDVVEEWSRSGRTWKLPNLVAIVPSTPQRGPVGRRTHGTRTEGDCRRHGEAEGKAETAFEYLVVHALPGQADRSPWKSRGRCQQQCSQSACWIRVGTAPTDRTSMLLTFLKRLA